MNNHQIGSVEWLQVLRTLADKACADARDLHRVKGLDTPFSSDAVNWGDLGCYNARWFRDSDGIEGAEVEISEASPDGAFFFRQWVQEQLAARGYLDVSVKTEW